MIKDKRPLLPSIRVIFTLFLNSSLRFIFPLLLPCLILNCDYMKHLFVKNWLPLTILLEHTPLDRLSCYSLVIWDRWVLLHCTLSWTPSYIFLWSLLGDIQPGVFGHLFRRFLNMDANQRHTN